MSRRPILVGETFAPWTKKARWALEHCGVAYDYQEYTPTLSEPGLRLRLRQWSGSVSVPVMFTEGQILRGSWEIASYANDASSDKRLGDFKTIEPWNMLSEDALAEGRTQIVRSIIGNDTALTESLPGFIPGILRRPMRFMARDAATRLDRKYAHLVKPGALRQALLQTRETLKQIDGDYLQGYFSYADITMAVVLEVVAPIARHQPPLGPATQACWNNEDLAKEFEDLILWRNRLAGNADTSYSQFRS